MAIQINIKINTRISPTSGPKLSVRKIITTRASKCQIPWSQSVLKASITHDTLKALTTKTLDLEEDFPILINCSLHQITLHTITGLHQTGKIQGNPSLFKAFLIIPNISTPECKSILHNPSTSNHKIILQLPNKDLEISNFPRTSPCNYKLTKCHTKWWKSQSMKNSKKFTKKAEETCSS